MQASNVRTYEKLGVSDLQEMKCHALKELSRFYVKVGKPAGKYKVYKHKLIAICLCQGAAQHFVNGTTGIKDLDIWFFFKEDANVKIPDIKNMRYSVDKLLKNLGVKRIDFLKKSIKASVLSNSKTQQPQDLLRAYLQHANTTTSKELAKKPVVGLYPEKIFGVIIWQPTTSEITDISSLGVRNLGV